jgi:hypothetical protein
MLIDLDWPAATPVSVRRASRSKRAPRIDADTPIVPHAVAAGVWSEACVWLGEELPRDWIAELVTQANTIYARNPRFRRNLRSKGNRGRDWLWVFTRHWLCATIRKHRPDLHRRLPDSYNSGSPLPVVDSQPATRSRPGTPASAHGKMDGVFVCE